MRQLDTTYHSGMAGYLMDFGFGGFIGYDKEELRLKSYYIFEVRIFW